MKALQIDTKWPTQTIGEIGQVFDGPHATPKTIESGPLFLGISSIVEGKIILKKTRHVTEADFVTWTRRVTPKAGDVVFAYETRLGQVALIPENMRCCLGRRMGLVRLNQEKVDPDYFVLCYMSPPFQKFLRSRIVQGATVDRIHLKDFVNFPFPLPPLEEQKRIVAVLDAAFEGLTRATENAEANLQNARELFDSFASSIITDSLADYATVSLADVSDILDRQRVPITKSARVTGDVPYYGASGVVDYVTDYLFDEELLLVSEDGANLLARTYPIAFSVSGKTWVNNHAHVLRFKDRSQQEFVSLYLNSISLEPYVSGMAQPKLNQKALNKIPIPDLPENLCATIVRQATELRETVEALETNYRIKLTDIADLRQSLLQKAFAGELT